MRKTRFQGHKKFVLLVTVAAILLLGGCSVNVKKEQDGADKQVDIKTPLGGIHVGKEADPEDVGIPVYPGAQVARNDNSDNDKSANVNLSGFGYALKVVVLEYQSDDPPAKVIAYYRDQLQKYGAVLECHTSNFNVDTDIKNHDQGSHELACEGSSGSNTELKVGTKENQHIVAVKPQGKGSSFSLVYVHTHGKDAEI